MKIRIIIERSAWRYKLAFGRDLAGHWFAKLTNHGGQRVGMILATTEASVDAMINNAARIYADLESRIEPATKPFPAASARDNSKITKPTTVEKETETSAASTAASTGA